MSYPDRIYGHRCSRRSAHDELLLEDAAAQFLRHRDAEGLGRTKGAAARVLAAAAVLQARAALHSGLLLVKEVPHILEDRRLLFVILLHRCRWLLRLVLGQVLDSVGGHRLLQDGELRVHVEQLVAEDALEFLLVRLVK